MKNFQSTLLTVLAGLAILAPLRLGAEPVASASAPASAAEEPLAGIVMETMDAGRYTYIRIKSGDQEHWAAGLETEVAVGDAVHLIDAIPMTNFESATLKRTFDTIFFASEIQVAGKPPRPRADPLAAGSLPPGHPPIGGQDSPLPPGHPPIGGSSVAAAGGSAVDAPLAGEVIQSLSGGRYTYIEVKMDSGSRWLASPEMALTPGQQIRFAEGMEMTDFESPSLGRSFPSIYFVPGVHVAAP